MPVTVQVTYENPRLPHQIRIRVGTNSQVCQVSCNCRRMSTGGWKSFGEVDFTDLAGMWALYDDESNHNQQWHPFKSGDRTPKEFTRVW